MSTETLVGAPAVQKATSCTLELDPLPTPTLVRLRASEQGVTLTDVQRRWGLRAGQLSALQCSMRSAAQSCVATSLCSQLRAVLLSVQWVAVVQRCWDAMGPCVGLRSQNPRGAPCPDAVPPPRRVFFRRHYPLSALRFCGMDPEGRK